MSSLEIVLLDRGKRLFRSGFLKGHGYEVFATEHVVEVCLHWSPEVCAALVIGPDIPWQQVATLCDWIKINNPEKPIILLGDRRGLRRPPIDAVVPTQPASAMVEQLRALLPVPERAGKAGTPER